ncbi:MAG: tRNA (adenosine(37)-N6)-dimethylallyltransferase MiaA, partial [Candidatus Planktophila sp.]|nr:tRNA (adenosine(37)-N6)-dimethylallyltransferase MiaA [Candidatus Planktophila sp.]
EKFDGEIINADSMQLYKGMDIGTAKLTKLERRGIPHHLLDILGVRQDASVAAYQELARSAIEDIQGRNKVAILVGGTGLYIKSVIDEMNFPETDPGLRAKLESEAELLGTAELYSRLRLLDPEAAAAIEPANTRRIIRALEVIEVTGKPYSANLPSDTSLRFPDALHISLAMERTSLAPRIEARVHRMFDQGLINEVERLIVQGLLEGTTAQRAIGYAQVISLINGQISKDQAIEETIVATRQYVRRQETWFKRDQRIQWIGEGEPRLPFIEERINS